MGLSCYKSEGYKEFFYNHIIYCYFHDLYMDDNYLIYIFNKTFYIWKKLFTFKKT